MIDEKTKAISNSSSIEIRAPAPDTPAEPNVSGVDGTQVVAPVSFQEGVARRLPTGNGIQPYHSSDVLRELADTGGHPELQSPLLLYALMHKQETESQRLNHEVARLRVDIAKIQDLLTESRRIQSLAERERDVMEERLGSFKDVRLSQNISATIGTLMVGFGGALFDKEEYPLAVIVGVFGLLLLAASWFTPTRKAPAAQGESK